MKKEDILNQFLLPEDFLRGKKLNKEEQEFLSAYKIASFINQKKSYSSQKLKGICLKERNTYYNVKNKSYVELFNLYFNPSNGKFYKEENDFTIACRPTNLTLKRYYFSDNQKNCSRYHLLGNNWVLEYETYCNYESNKIVFYFADGNKETFYKKETLFICENKYSENEIIKEDFEKQEIHFLKQNLIYIYAFDGRLKKVGDFYENFIEITYMNDQLIEGIYSSFGMFLKFFYENDKLSLVVDEIGRKIIYLYNENLLSSVIKPNNGKRHFDYETRFNRLCKIIDANENSIFQAEYDRYGIPVSINEFEIKYDKSKKETKFDNKDILIVYKYNEKNRIEKIIHSRIGTIEFKYDKAENIVSKVNTKGQITFYQYDNFNRLICIKLPDNKKIQYEYKNKQISKFSLSTGYYKLFNYEKNGSLTEVKYTIEKGKLASCKYKYDMLGRLIEKINANGNKVFYEYKDEYSIYPNIKIYENDFKEYYEYDAVGRLIRKVSNKESVEYKYNNIDLKIQTIFADGSSDFRRYDLEGNLKEIIMPQENSQSATVHKFHYFYNEKNRLIKILAPNGTVFLNTKQSQNKSENKDLKICNLAGKIIEKRVPMKLDSNGEILYQLILYSYDKCFQIVSKKIGCEYVKEKEIPDRFFEINYKYDSFGNITEIKTPSKVIKCYYTDKNKLQKKLEKNENYKIQTVFEYNEKGLLFKIKKFLDMEDIFLEELKINKISPFIKIETIFTYNLNNQLIEIELPNKNKLEIKYDLNGTMINTIETWFIEIKEKNELLLFENNIQKERITDYIFERDIAKRITKVLSKEDKKIIAEYEYDCLNNITAVIRNNNKTKFLYDRASRLIKIIYSDASYEVFQYDCCENVINYIDKEKKSTYYSYNSMNKLGFMKTEKEEIEYKYNELGEISFQKKK